jgi:hypothetical protein
MAQLIVVVRIGVAWMVGIGRAPRLDSSIRSVGIGDVNDAAVGKRGQHLGRRDLVAVFVLKIILSVDAVIERADLILRRPPKALTPLLQTGF